MQIYWTPKTARKIGYTLIFILSALPVIGFWVLVGGTIALEVAIRKGLIKNLLPSATQGYKHFESEISLTTDSAERARLLTADCERMAGTALVDGFVYLYGPAVLLIISTLTLKLDMLPQGVDLPALKRTITITTGWTLFASAFWILIGYLRGYAKRKWLLKILEEKLLLRQLRSCVGSLRPIAWTLIPLSFVAASAVIKYWGLAQANLAAAILVLPCVWPLIFAALYLKRSQKLAAAQPTQA